MKLRDHYDWVVLGDHPGALLSASLVARLGLSVLILPVYPGKGLISASDGRTVDLESNYLLGLGQTSNFNGLLGDCLKRLGVLPIELDQIVRTRPLSQILTPKLRLDFSPDDESLEHSLQRELGKGLSQQVGLLPALRRAESEYLAFWLNLPERLTLSPDKKRTTAPAQRIQDLRRKLSKQASGQPLARWLVPSRSAVDLGKEVRFPEIVELLEGFWFGSNGATLENSPLDELLHLLVLARTGASYQGGMTAYREFLLRLAKRLGAHVPPKLECKRIFVDRGRFTGVQVANRANIVSGGGAVVGCALSQLTDLVSMSGRNLWKRLKPSPGPEGWRFTICFRVAAAAFSPGASSRMVWQEAGAPPIEIEVGEPEKVGTAKNIDQRVVMARTILPFNEESLRPEFQRNVAARLLRQLTTLFPFFENHLLTVYPDFRGPTLDRAHGELQEVYGFSNLAAIPENLRCLRPERGVGVGALSGIEGLFVASGESFPELGSFGGTVAALEAVSWLAHRGGLSGPFA